MKPALLTWTLYEITTDRSAINGVMFRGRIRKLGLEKGFNVLVENTEDKVNGVRFAVLSKQDADIIIEYINSVLEDASVTTVLEDIANPVLSKLKINQEAIYEL